MIGVSLVFAGLVVALVVSAVVIERIDRRDKRREAAARRRTLDEMRDW